MHEVKLEPDEGGAYASSLIQLRGDAYAVEAALIRDDRIPGLREEESEFITAQLNWLKGIDAGTWSVPSATASRTEPQTSNV